MISYVKGTFDVCACVCVYVYGSFRHGLVQKLMERDDIYITRAVGSHPRNTIRIRKEKCVGTAVKDTARGFIQP